MNRSGVIRTKRDITRQVFDVATSCRICMTKNVNMRDLFIKSNKTLIENIKFCTGVALQKEDGLPTGICKTCIDQLSISYKFKTLCISSEQYFENYLAGKIKPDLDENNDIDDKIISDDDEGDSKITFQEEIIYDDECDFKEADFKYDDNCTDNYDMKEEFIDIKEADHISDYSVNAEDEAGLIESKEAQRCNNQRKSKKSKKRSYVNIYSLCGIIAGKKRKVGIRKYGTKSSYLQKDLDEALSKIKNCQMSQREAARHYKIPRSTLKYKLKGEHSKPIGKPITFTEHEEKIFLNHIKALADLGIPVEMHDVCSIVKRYLDDEGRTIKNFNNNKPGYEWERNFLYRHPDIKQYISFNIRRKRPQISKEMIENFFSRLKIELADVPPENLYIFDETGFHSNPKVAQLLYRRSCRSPEILKNTVTSCFTTIFCGNAKGEFLPPFTIYKAKQVGSKWLDGAPAGTKMAVTESGWIDIETFEVWFQSLVLPVLKKKPGKKVILGDSLSIHISVKTLQLCEKNNIKFICMIPNSTHLLQPLDFAYFSSLKSKWRSVLSDWGKTRFRSVPHTVLAALLKKTLDLIAPTAGCYLTAGFKFTGLYPCDVNILLNKVFDLRPNNARRKSIGGKNTQIFQTAVSAGNGGSVGSNNGQAKKRKITLSIDSSHPSGSEEENCVGENSDEEGDEDVESSPNIDNISFSDAEEIFDESEQEPQESEIEEDILDSNMSKAENHICIINYEGSLIPGRIIKADHPKYTFSVMLKAEKGWFWPRSNLILSVNYTNVIRVLNDTNIQEKTGFFTIEDDLLSMEWED